MNDIWSMTDEELLADRDRLVALMDEEGAAPSAPSVQDGAVYDSAPNPDAGPDGMTEDERLWRTGSVHPTVAAVNADAIPADEVGTEARLVAALGGETTPTDDAG